MRRAKSDGIDAELLLRTLLAWLRGEPRVCSMAPVPDEADEDARRAVRERAELVAERVSLVKLALARSWRRSGPATTTRSCESRRRRLDELRTASDQPLPKHARAKIIRLLTRLELVLAQIAELDELRDAVLEDQAPDAAGQMIQQLAGCAASGCRARPYWSEKRSSGASRTARRSVPTRA